jgi:hypothetical protein
MPAVLVYTGLAFTAMASIFYMAGEAVEGAVLLLNAIL